MGNASRRCAARPSGSGGSTCRGRARDGCKTTRVGERGSRPAAADLRRGAPCATSRKSMIDTRQALEFEKPIVELENKIEELKGLGHGKIAGEVRRLERKARLLQERVFAELTAFQ